VLRTAGEVGPGRDEDGHAAHGTGPRRVPLGLAELERRPHLVLDQHDELLTAAEPEGQVDVGLALVLQDDAVVPVVEPRSDLDEVTVGQRGPLAPFPRLGQEPAGEVVVDAQLLGQQEVEAGLPPADAPTSATSTGSGVPGGSGGSRESAVGSVVGYVIRVRLGSLAQGSVTSGSMTTAAHASQTLAPRVAWWDWPITSFSSSPTMCGPASRSLGGASVGSHTTG